MNDSLCAFPATGEPATGHKQATVPSVSRGLQRPSRATGYDQVYAKPERQADLTILRDDIAGSVLACKRVLEVAAGTGWWTDVLAARAVTRALTSPQ